MYRMKCYFHNQLSHIELATKERVLANSMQVMVFPMHRQCTIKNIQCLVMFGAMVAYCMKFGAWDTSHLKK